MVDAIRRCSSNVPCLLSASRPLAGSILREGAIRAGRMAEQRGEAGQIRGTRHRAVRLVPAQHQTQVHGVPARHHAFHALLHRDEIIAPVAHTAPQRFAPDRRDLLAGQAVRPDQAIGLNGKCRRRAVSTKKLNRRTVDLRPEPVLRLSSLAMVRDAVLAGAGAALLPKMLVADDIAAGRLVAWGKQEGPPVEIWALHSSRRLMGAKVRAFIEVLEQAFPKKGFLPSA